MSDLLIKFKESEIRIKMNCAARCGVCMKTLTKMIRLQNREKTSEEIDLRTHCAIGCADALRILLFELISYIHKAYEITPKYKLDDRFIRCIVFFENNNYQELLDTFIDEMFSITPYYSKYSSINRTTLFRKMLDNKSRLWYIVYIEFGCIISIV